MIRRLALSPALTLFAAATAAGQDSRPSNYTPDATGVILLEPYETAVPKPGTLEDIRLQALARIDPADPLAGKPNLQTFSLFGREDLIAETSYSYQPTPCVPGNENGDVLEGIVEHARNTSVVIINESHERSEHRGFTTALLGPLRVEGYTALALEALSNPPPDTLSNDSLSFIRDPSLAYLEDDDGYYIGEAGFGRLGRTAKRLGYSLVPYETQYSALDANISRAESIARREEAQATALASWIGEHPGEKLIVHVGYSHANEVLTARGDSWMAMRLKAKTGIDPITISQTTCRGGGTISRVAALPAVESAGTFDFVIDHPTARFVHSRPAWRVAAGDVPVSIPDILRQTNGWRVIEARPDGEPETSVPMDRVAIRPGEDVALMLAPGRYRLRIVDVQPEEKMPILPAASDMMIP